MGSEIFAIGVGRVFENMNHDYTVAETSSVHCGTNDPFQDPAS